jgi:uncharacterized protein (DUF302 family)
MNYYHSRMIKLEFDNAIKVVTETLKKEGFGVLSQF